MMIFFKIYITGTMLFDALLSFNRASFNRLAVLISLSKVLIKYLVLIKKKNLVPHHGVMV